MFRRLWSGLPKDPQFLSDLKELGYFVNVDDEIRSIEEPNNYFKFFLTKNARFNERQRFAMNEACEKLVHTRLEDLGLIKVLLPLGATDPGKPHMPIFVSSDIKEKSRVVLIFGESVQDLGVLAHRVLGGQGGVDKGSMVSIVKELQTQRSSAADSSPPGIVLANTGQTLWLPELQRALTYIGAEGAPMASAVHNGMHIHPDKNKVPENANKKEHVRYVFEKVVPALVKPAAGLDIVGVGDGADTVAEYLDLGVTWGRLQGRINCFAIVGGYHDVYELKCKEFITFLREKACAWTISNEVLGTIISGPDGNPNTTTFTDIGCPIFSGGDGIHVETLLINCHKEVSAWIQKVALTKDYKNLELDVTFADEKFVVNEDPDWTEHHKAHEEWEKLKEQETEEGENKVTRVSDSEDDR